MFATHSLTLQWQHVIGYGSNSQLYLSKQHIIFSILLSTKVPISSAGNGESHIVAIILSNSGDHSHMLSCFCFVLHPTTERPR